MEQAREGTIDVAFRDARFLVFAMLACSSGGDSPTETSGGTVVGVLQGSTSGVPTMTGTWNNSFGGGGTWTAASNGC